ncbi:MAG: CBS domain-containing protein [Pseudomonadota bacterium]|uniref:CBS domain-containing protein n=1 Tax=Alcanivorax sp. TaxID=1872427 RepID=UPI0025C5A69E|nr:CBS domain-containing protein [Alcanivorax sp.]MED5239317.1 CBS domain-containing protein [Pseudomonadota bacterium]MEE3321968.1 CBS domain-containing protein [Pseudomonadota bacterium]
MLKSMLVADYMSRRVITLSPEQSVHDAISVLLEHKISGAPVVDENGQLKGMFSESDCLKGALEASYHGTEIGPVSEYMTLDLQTVTGQTSILDAAEIFLADHRRRLPVVDEGKLVGQISRRDLLRAMDDFSRNSS